MEEQNLTSIYKLIQLALDNCIELHEIIESNIFKDIDLTKIEGLIPLWIIDAGISAESGLDKVKFEKLVSANNNELTHKLLYRYDCKMLVATLQDKLSAVGNLTSYFYRDLTPNSRFKTSEYERGVMYMNEKASVCFTLINSLVVVLCSMFDILTKICIEFDNIRNNKIDFTNYPKLKSSGKIYGQRNLIDTRLIENTIFKETPIIRMAISIRDEIVHNGTWDFSPTIYGGYKGEEYEEWIMMPDFQDGGTFESYKNRKRFYSEGNKMNVDLIPFLIEILKLINQTISEMNSFYKVKNVKKKYDINSFSKEIQNWSTSISAAFLKNEY